MTFSIHPLDQAILAQAILAQIILAQVLAKRHNINLISAVYWSPERWANAVLELGFAHGSAPVLGWLRSVRAQSLRRPLCETWRVLRQRIHVRYCGLEQNLKDGSSGIN